MTKENKNTRKVPNLRFPGFTEEWETRKIKNILTIGSGRDYKHLSEGNIPVFGTGGFMASVDSFLYDGESVCIGRKGTINKPFYFNGKFWTVDTLFFTHSFKNVLPKFIYYIFEQINWLKYNEASGVPSLSKSTIEQIEIDIPSIDEQKKITNFLNAIDLRIDCSIKTIEQLETLIKGVSKKLFSQKIRFKEFTDDWETRKLGEVSKIVNNRNNENKNLPVYSINNKQGFVPQSEQFEGIDSTERGYDVSIYKIIAKHTFAYNPARINVGSVGYSGELENIIISSLYVCFKTSENIHDNFLWYYLKSELFNKEVLKNVEGGVREYLFYENFSRINFTFPSLKEQTKIALFLSSIDKKIETEKALLNQLENQKQYLLQSMFA